MRIRTATVDDAPVLQRYAEELFAERLPGIFLRDTPTLEEEVAFIRGGTEPENCTILIAEEAGEILGIIDFRGGTLLDQRHSGELGISVAREHRGRGIGTQLIEALLAWARGAGIHRVEVRCWSTNPRALALYRRCGFEDEGRLHDEVFRDGEYVDTHVLAMLL